MAGKLVLCRHGQSDWNLKNLFTGWKDVDLTPQGNDEAIAAGKLLHELGYEFDIAYTSVLKRAIRTLWHILDQMDLMWIPVVRDWRLNERHYGALQGLDKKETTRLHGEEQVLQWRRGYAVRPPALSPDDPQHPANDPRYRGIADLPATESLADTLVRVMQWWQQCVIPELKSDRTLLIVTHGNSLRALVKHLEGYSEDEIMQYNIPTGIPLVYQFNDDLSVAGSEYLADPTALEAAVSEVKNQAASKN